MRPSRSTLLGMFLIAGIVVLTRLPSLFVPIIDVDEAMFANMSRALMRGDVLYIDAIDHKPPLMYAFYALGLLLHDDMVAVHLLTMLWVFLTALVIWRLAELWFGKNCGFLSASLFALFTSPLSIATTTETIFNLPLCVAFLCATIACRTNSLRWSFFAGICLSIATLVKHQALLACPALVFLMLISMPRHERMRSLFSGVVGFLSPYALLLAWASHQGNVHELWQWGYAFNFSYLGAHVPSEDAQRLALATLVNIGLYTLLLWILAGQTLWKRRNERVTQTVLLWLAGSCGAAALGLRFYSHYFIQLIPPLAILAAPALLSFWRKRSAHKILTLIVLGSALFLPALGKMSQRMWMMSQESKSKWGALENVAALIRQHTSPDDAVFIWGNDTSALFLANRRSGSRFAHSSMMLGNLDPCLLPKDFDVASLSASPLYTTLFVDLEQRRPTIFVDTSTANAHRWGPFSPTRFPELSAYLDAYYRPLGIVSGYSIYVRSK